MPNDKTIIKVSLNKETLDMINKYNIPDITIFIEDTIKYYILDAINNKQQNIDIHPNPIHNNNNTIYDYLSI